jgi:hypothetical protein
MAGLGESLAELKTAWEAIPADKRTAASEQATVAALMAGDALRILRDHLPTLAAPAAAAGTKAAIGHLMWRIPIAEIFDVIGAVFPELVKVLTRVAKELGFEDDTPAPVAPPASTAP